MFLIGSKVRLANSRVVLGISPAANIQFRRRNGTVAGVAQDVTKIGDLQSMGLSHWTPPGLVESLLESVYITTGMPWWATIVASTLAARSLLVFPIQMKAYKNQAKLKLIKDDVLRLTEEQKMHRDAGNQEKSIECMKKIIELYQSVNLNPLSNLMTPFATAPIFFSFFMALRDITALELTSMKTGGALWFNDLTIADPTYVLPLTTAALFLITLETGADFGQSQQSQQMKRIFRIMTITSVPFMAQFPAALCVYWTSNSVISLISSFALRRIFAESKTGTVVKGKSVLSAPKAQDSFKEGFMTQIQAARTQRQKELNERLYGSESIKQKKNATK
ncbi:hypothetical protein MP638_006270 [Amoeboaphelidium occidentale]|nr:hypothetical protein MP638_006270 [Amoeboaphelidium occidentale]